MSRKIREIHHALLVREQRLVTPGSGTCLRVCLVYPQRYRTGMSNLGFQAVHALLNRMPGVRCERAFLPDPAELREYERTGTPLLALESQQPVRDFDLVAFSVSFESDYLHIPELLRRAGIPPLAVKRDATAPLVIAGGAALFLNPEPVADFLDLVCVGEAEPVLPPLLELLGSEPCDRPELLRRAARLPGVYVPALYDVVCAGPRELSRTPREGVPATVHRVWAADPERPPTASTLLTPDTEFGDLFLVELSRGCPRGCRFCAAGFIYEPFRQHSLEQVKEQVRQGLAQRQRIGLVSAAVGDFRGIGELCRFILAHGGKVSVSSLRVDALDREMIGVLIASGHKTVTLAPEGGSQRLRELIRKNLTEEQILAACGLLVTEGILNLKLYFMIGLPTETDEDLAELTGLVGRIRARVVAAARDKGRLGTITVAVNPFVPKPFTPFQWCGMEAVPSLERKAKLLRRELGRLANVRLQLESPRDAYRQALLARGNRSLAPLLLRAAELGSWREAVAGQGLDLDPFVHRQIPLDETLPWDFIASGSRERLVAEYLRAGA